TGDKMADKKSFESSLHDIVYSIDMGVGLKVIRGLLYFLVLLLVIGIYTATQYRGLSTDEAMDFAQLGRNLSIKDGMTTKFVRPLSMWQMSEKGSGPQIQNHPDLFHPPAYPSVLSAGFNLLKSSDADVFALDGSKIGLKAEKWVILPINHLFSILTGFMVLLIGKRMFSHEIGFIGMTIYYLSDLVWKDSISGLNISMAIFFIVAAFYFMIVSMLNKRDGKKKVRWLIPFFLSILFAAIAFLTRYISIVAVPGLCLFAWLMSGRFRGGTRYVLIFAVLFSALIAPWLIRNVRACGNPLGMVAYTALSDTQDYPGNTLERDLKPDFTLGSSLDWVKEKWTQTYSENHAAAVPAIGGGILTAMFLVAFFYHFMRPQVNYLRWGIGISLLLMLGVAGFFSESSVAMLHAFWPFIILYGLSFFYILIDRLDLGVPLYEQGLKVLIVLLAMIPAILRVMPPRANPMYPQYYPELISRVGMSIRPNETVCTDMPWATAWYGDRASMLLPRTLEQYFDVEFLNVDEGYSPIRALYLTRMTSDKPLSMLYEGDEKVWLGFMLGARPTQFPNWKSLQLTNGQILMLDPSREFDTSGMTKE
ncbi:MAG: glycosyltransferase family 39 protein, partial [Pontiellaceae bacterium]|nr:glycosyltransferase family 39 protein [Pontiellaceae bacterium]